jgi:hypothetical protein
MLTRRQTPLKKLPMMLLAVVISFQRALVRGAAPFPQRVPRGFASASVCDMHQYLQHEERGTIPATSTPSLSSAPVTEQRTLLYPVSVLRVPIPCTQIRPHIRCSQN